ncbi:probable ATP-dependent RNA helicase DDX28 [Sceloporus undulatus]|uniref:probable ATP-dependent RNA helicase DDX28 n=1 Tax=Sceloporus undulatus TaxID=8520 RepID=UPI001C4D41ED|nr:probable ATP-dependent RNA helicase DDX28 [Sceloporus undulatus]
MALSVCGALGRFLSRRRLWGVLRWSSEGPEEAGKAEAVVRIPHSWQLRLEQRGQPGPSKGDREVKRGKLLLRSRRKELSQAARLTVGRWERPRLVSDGWKHRLSRGDYFQLERTRKEAPQEKDPEAVSFEALGLEPQLASLLVEAFGISSPTPVQRQALPALLKGNNALCAAETGSGKTLAYLLPVLQRLLRDRHLPRRLGSVTFPRSLVVLPSRELAAQVRGVALPLCAPLGLEVREICGGRGIGGVRRKIRGVAVDLLVATPGALSKALRRRILSLQELRFLVLDEADTLLDPTFVDLVEDSLRQAPLAATKNEADDTWDPKTQLVAVGATLPKGLRELLSEVADLDAFKTLTGSSLHYLQPHVEQRFVRLKGADKVTELLQLIKDRQPSSGAVLVFCNNASTVNWLGYILDDHKVKHLRLQGQMQAQIRSGIFDAFQKGQSDILVCTDIASRGLDTTHVELVVNYDFPPTLHDYLHRVGRVGRTGSKFPGTAVSFVTHRWDVDLVRKIETAARKRTRLPGLEPVVSEAASPKAK